MMRIINKLMQTLSIENQTKLRYLYLFKFEYIVIILECIAEWRK